MKRTFASNTLGKTPKTSNKQQGKKILNISFFFLGAILIGALSVAMMSNFETIWSSLKQSGIKAISKTVGTPMQRDENDNVNVLLLGYGGAGHDGGFLTDSIIIASRNPEVGNISMFSIPRDLRVKYPTGGYGRINANFYLHLRKNNDDFSLALSGMAQDISKMLGISIPYYATIDF